MPLAVLAAGVIWGSVSVGPTTPVCRVGSPCSGPAKNATVTFSRAGRVVTTKTDGSGRYRLSLRIGTWNVRVNVGMRVAPSSIVVRTGTHRENLSVDTGIR